ncbi:hypothetical protein AALA36_01830 [Lachnospiraceae bacterium 66-29]
MKATSYQFSGVSAGVGLSGGKVQNVNVSKNKNKTNNAKKANQKKMPKKQLNYNPREIRNALLLAHDSQSAGRVMVQAKGKLSSLAKWKGSGQFDEKQLANAITHARRMVQCAQMKNRNLKKEEQLQKRYAHQEKMEEQKKRIEIKHQVQQKKMVLEQKQKMAKVQKVQKERQHMEELLRKRRMNRLKERGKMNEADEEYQKNMGRCSAENNPMQNYGTVYIPVEGVEIALSEEAIHLTEEQLEQQAEMMMQAALDGTMTMITPNLAEFSGEAVLTGGAAMEGGTVDLVL